MNFEDDFKGKSVIVTGAASGLGRDIALGFARAGARVTVADVDSEKGVSVVEEIKKTGTGAVFAGVDVGSEDQVKAMVDTALKAFGGVDILVNNAGHGGSNLGNPLTRVEVDDFDAAYNVILKGTFLCCRAVYDLFKGQGHGKIVNISSVAGRVGNTLFPQYSAAKSAVINFTQTLARELGPYNINVNCVCPGYIYTPMWERLGEGIKQYVPGIPPGATPRDIFLGVVRERTAMKREQTGDDVANAVMFLASGAARNITGQVLSVCGGTVMF